MDEDLAKMSCEPCGADTQRMSNEEVYVQRKRIPGWLIASRSGFLQLRRDYRFDRFITAFVFVISVARLAEREGHSPTLVIEQGNVSIKWWTPQIGGLHRNDFIMAAKTSVAYQEDLKSRLDPLFEESPMIQALREKRRAQFVAEGRLKALQESYREILVTAVQAKFPDLAELAQQQASRFEELDELDFLVRQVMVAPDATLVRMLLESEEET